MLRASVRARLAGPPDLDPASQMQRILAVILCHFSRMGDFKAPRRRGAPSSRTISVSHANKPYAQVVLMEMIFQWTYVLKNVNRPAYPIGVFAPFCERLGQNVAFHQQRNKKGGPTSNSRAAPNRH